MVLDYLNEEQEHLVIQVLITLVQNAPVLYVKSFNDYRNTEKRLQKFQEFVPLVTRSTKIKINNGYDLMELWNHLHAKFSSIRSKMRKTNPGSGSGAGHEELQEVSNWPYYQQLQFLVPYISPPEIKSSRVLREKNMTNPSSATTMPKLAPYAKRKKSQIDRVDEEIVNTSKLIQRTIGKMLDDDLDNSCKKSVNTASSNIEENAYCAAIIKSYLSLAAKDRFEGFVLIINEIQNLKLSSI